VALGSFDWDGLVLLNVDTGDQISLRLQAAIYRESIALVEADVVDAADVDRVIQNSIGRRWAVGGPFEIWEQIGWDLVQVIAGELFGDISVATAANEISLPSANKIDNSVESSAASNSKFQNVAVIGAGLLGHGIALELATHGKRIFLNDISESLLADAIARARVGLAALATVGRISENEIDDALSRITTSTDLGESVKTADLVIEAASENLELKKKIFAEIDLHAPGHAILASNSSTFVPSAYGSATSRSENVVGLHYFNPPHLLPGMEIITGPDTLIEVIDLVKSEYESIGKKPAIVRAEIQGFVSNRLQVALLREAMSIVESDEASSAEVDELVRDGFGPQFAQTGVFGSVSRSDYSVSHSDLVEQFDNLNNGRELPKILLDKIESGDLGVKVGKGFYEWTPESAEAWRANMANSLLHMG
jgi:3-hydroxyacyl-CoA dehydrogenase